MSDASSIASLLTQTITANTRAQANAKAEIVRLAAQLQALKQAETLRGEIIAITKDGQVTIQTERGEVVLRTDQAKQLEVGKYIEVRIDAGSPPETALLKTYVRAEQNVQTAQNQGSEIYTIARQTQLPQTLTLNEVTQSPELLLTPHSASQSVTAPFSNEVQSRVTPLSELSLQTTQNGSLPITRPETAPFTFSVVTPLNAPSENADLILSPPKANLIAPFRSIAAQIISAPLQEPISDHDFVNPSKIDSIKIERILSPPPELSGEAIDRVSTLNAPITLSQAILTGFTENQNFAVLQIQSPERLSDQQYALQVPIEDIPVGSRIDFSIVKSTEIPLPALTSSYFLTPSSWPILEETQQVLTQVSPQTSQAFNAVVPNAAAPAQLDSTALFFVAAMRAGDVNGWLGEKAVDAIKRAGKSDLLSRLGREIRGITRMSSEALSGDWRAMSLPLAWQNDINKIALYFRNEGEHNESNDEAGKGKKTRFVMDLSLTNMGNVQLDGLFSGQDNIGRLDLVLRTEQSFSQSMRQQMRTAYKNALEETQITGELSFQNQPESWVRITPDTVKEYHADV